MGVLEEQARFVTAKYGTAAGPTGLTPAQSAASIDIATLMIILGILIFIAIFFLLARDFAAQQTMRRELRRS